MGDRTYDWNGHTNLPISYPDLSDFHMAGKVRMLMRSDLDHEGVVCGARDRIMCLSKEKTDLAASLKLALDHIEHMAAFIGNQKAGYSFESLGEDMPGMRAALNPSGAEDACLGEHQEVLDAIQTHNSGEDE